MVIECFYFFFLKVFFILKDLVNVLLEEVLLFWRGFGYYLRVKNLKKSVEICVKEYDL